MVTTRPWGANERNNPPVSRTWDVTWEGFSASVSTGMIAWTRPLGGAARRTSNPIGATGWQSYRRPCPHLTPPRFHPWEPGWRQTLGGAVLLGGEGPGRSRFSW